PPPPRDVFIARGRAGAAPDAIRAAGEQGREYRIERDIDARVAVAGGKRLLQRCMIGEVARNRALPLRLRDAQLNRVTGLEQYAKRAVDLLQVVAQLHGQVSARCLSRAS